MSGTLKLNNIQLGDSVTDSNNFSLVNNQDGSITLARGNIGATTQDVLKIDADGKVVAPQGAKSVDSDVMRILHIPAKIASGTFIDFSPADGSGIPSWAKEITILLAGVSTNGTSTVEVRFGTASGIETNGYLGSMQTGTSAIAHGTGFRDTASARAAASTEVSVFSFAYLTANVWVGTIKFSAIDTAGVHSGTGQKSMAGVLDRIRITTVNGTDTFDAGSISIIVKG